MDNKKVGRIIYGLGWFANGIGLEHSILTNNIYSWIVSELAFAILVIIGLEMEYHA